MLFRILLVAKQKLSSVHTTSLSCFVNVAGAVLSVVCSQTPNFWTRQGSGVTFGTFDGGMNRVQFRGAKMLLLFW